MKIIPFLLLNIDMKTIILRKFVKKKNASNCWIYVSIELNNGIIASGGEDKLIKLWKD
jgi:hypothetical protein